MLDRQGRVELNLAETEKNCFSLSFMISFWIMGLESLNNLKSKDVDGYDSLEHDFGIHLAFQLQNICLRTLVSEMHSYKQRGLLSGKDGKEEYSYFCGHIVGSTNLKMNYLHSILFCAVV